MKLTKTSGASIAMTAAALIVSGAALIATANAETFKGRCFGVNGCAGKGACKTAANDCKGKNCLQGQRLARDAQHRVRRPGRHVREELRLKHQARAGRGRGRLRPGTRRRVRECPQRNRPSSALASG